MVRRAAWLASALALCAGLAVHAATSQRMVEQLQFERDGTPNEAMQERVRAAGLPPLIFGRNIIYPARLINMNEPACVVVQFLIRKDGLTDMFSVIDAQPSRVIERYALAAVATWRFEAPDEPRTVILPINFIMPVTVGTRLERRAVCRRPAVEGTAFEHTAGVIPRLAFNPHYTPELAASGVQGCISLAYTVTPEGLADEYLVVDAQPADTFLAVALSALNQWRFEPMPQAGAGHVRFEFRPDHAQPYTGPECRIPQSPQQLMADPASEPATSDGIH